MSHHSLERVSKPPGTVRFSQAVLKRLLVRATWALVAVLICCPAHWAGAAGIVFEGDSGPGRGKHIVLVSGDEEYRSEEGLPQLAKILARRHGFKCTVLFAIDRKDGTINPIQADNIPGLEALDTADLLVLLTRFRDLPDDQMQYIVDYVEAGKPVIGLRTATHALRPRPARSSPAGVGRARSGTADSAGRCWARPGSTTTAITASKARAA